MRECWGTTFCEKHRSVGEGRNCGVEGQEKTQSSNLEAKRVPEVGDTQRHMPGRARPAAKQRRGLERVIAFENHGCWGHIWGM